MWHLCSCCDFFGFPFVTTGYLCWRRAARLFVFGVVSNSQEKARPGHASGLPLFPQRPRSLSLSPLILSLFNFCLTLAATLEFLHFVCLPCCLVWEFVYLIMLSVGGSCFSIFLGLLISLGSWHLKFFGHAARVLYIA